MNGLPPDFDPSFLVGRRLDSVTIAEFSTFLSFDGGIVVSRERGFDEGYENVIGQSVVAAKVEWPGTVILDFGANDIIVLAEDESPYESYSIVGPGVAVYV